MNSDKNKPAMLLALALVIFVTGGFLMMVQIGVSGRKPRGMTYGFGFRSAPTPAPTAAAAPAYLKDFKKGVEVVKTKGQAFYDDIFGGSGAQTPPASGRTASARQEDSSGGGSEEDGDADGDAFEKYYRSNYANNYGKGGAAASAPGGGWEGGGGSYSGGGGSSSGGGDSETAQNVSRRTSQKAEGEEAASAAPGPAAAARTGFGGPAGGPERAASQQLQASLPQKRNADNGGLDAGAQPGASTDYSGKPHKGGGLSGMSGNGGAASLNGADEAAKTGGQTNFDAKMGGGAAAAAAGGGGKAAPAASGPKDVSGEKGGSDAGSNAAGGVKSSSDTDSGDNTSSWFAWGRGRSDSPKYPAAAPVEEDDQDIVKAVVKERQDGKEMKIITEEEAAGEPDEKLLAMGALTGDSDKELAIAEIDPADLKSLSPERRKAMKKEFHAFLKKVENKYGKMKQIYKTPCTSTPEVCKDHEVTGSYLTMTTEKGAKLVVGLKYVDKKWRRYTLDFDPGSVKPPAPKEDPEQGSEPEDENGVDDSEILVV